MYGGSALRICHGLDRMSVDLDFEIDHKITNNFLNKLKKEILKHFKDTYNVNSDLLTIGTTKNRGLTLKFHVAKELGLAVHSKQVHVKIDLNYFIIRPKIVIERWPQNKYQLSFIIKTYNMSALMASKVAAIFLRGQRGVDKDMYAEKGRDIYDLLWYMEKKIVPDLDYLTAKGVDVKDPRALFNKLTLQMNKVNDTNLKQDLTPLFINQTYIKDWLKNWRESYLRYLEEYKIRTATALRKIIVNEDFSTDNFSFTYLYDTAEETIIRIIYIVVYEWIKYQKTLGIVVNKDVVKLAASESHKELNDQQKQFITLFHQKTETYFKKTNRIMLGDTITTKLIRITADNLNQKEQILLNKSTLKSCELDDLLK
tara:strand:- start:1015 stop:2124 length:1110 start_codon:yes stop_codon:yes gene_type:complete